MNFKEFRDKRLRGVDLALFNGLINADDLEESIWKDWLRYDREHLETETVQSRA